MNTSRNCVFTPTVNTPVAFCVSSGVVSEEHTLIWTIENLNLVRKSEELTRSQKFAFKAGSSIGLPTEWQMCLRFNEEFKSSEWNMRWIGLFTKLTKKPAFAKEVYASWNIRIQKPVKFYKHMSFRDVTTLTNRTGMGWNRVIPKDPVMDEAKLPLNGSMEIQICFTVYAPKKIVQNIGRVTLCSKVRDFKIKSKQQLAQDLGNTEALTVPSADAATKIISKDNKEFPVNRGILSARSPVFQRMFRNKMAETITGEVHLDDMSSKAVEVLLQYMCTGTLHQDWKSEEVIAQLCNAAHKYELNTLFEFLDDAIGSIVSTMGFAKKLIPVALRLEMKKAEHALFEFAKKY